MELIDPKAVSTRIVFVREDVASLWHLADVSISRAVGGLVSARVEYMALHGKWIHPLVQVDTVSEMQTKHGPQPLICQRCLDEFSLAADLIKKKNLLRFIK